VNETPPDEVTMMTAVLTAHPDKELELVQVLGTLVGNLRDQATCLDCMAGQDLGQSQRFFLYLVWNNQASQERYLASEDFRVLLGASNILARPAVFRFTSTLVPLPTKAPRADRPDLPPLKAMDGVPVRATRLPRP
jgi:quinol monooxygenase YgiN